MSYGMEVWKMPMIFSDELAVEICFIITFLCLGDFEPFFIAIHPQAFDIV